MVQAQVKTPWGIYQRALVEYESDDPLRQRQGCEKGYLAAVEAVDKFLALHNRFVARGEPEAHEQRRGFLAELIEVDPNAEDIAKNLAALSEDLHGHCFYAGEQNQICTIALKKWLPSLLHLTGDLPEGEQPLEM